MSGTCTAASTRALRWATAVAAEMGATAAEATVKATAAAAAVGPESTYWRWRKEEAYVTYRGLLEQQVMELVREFNEANPDLVACVYDYLGTALVEYEILRGLLNAAQLSAIGVGLMLLYMTFHMRSLLLALLGLFGVVMSFPGASARLRCKN
eukprot:6180173-Pleurochrysis_carterae.AAC.1